MRKSRDRVLMLNVQISAYMGGVALTINPTLANPKDVFGKIGVSS